MKNTLELDLVWGGYYACKEQESGKFTLFRLLDFNQESYHYALFSEEFEELPTIEDIKNLKPFIGHIPHGTASLLLCDSLTLIHRKPLTQEDLDGYIYYLSEFNVSKDELDELIKDIIEFSYQMTLPIILYKSNGELQIEKRE